MMPQMKSDLLPDSVFYLILTDVYYFAEKIRSGCSFPNYMYGETCNEQL